MSWNYPFSWNTNNRSSREQLNTDRFSLLFDTISEMRRRLENSEQTINNLTTRIETLETANDNNTPPRLFNFETPRMATRNSNNRRGPRTYTTTFNTAPGAVNDATLTPLVDNLFNGIIAESLSNTRLGLSIEHLNANTTTELFIGNDEETSEDEQDACSICREPFANSSIIRKINSCGHKFHLNCIDTWFQNQYTCPMCRVSVRILFHTGNNRNTGDNEMPRLVNDNGEEQDE